MDSLLFDAWQWYFYILIIYKEKSLKNIVTIWNQELLLLKWSNYALNHWNITGPSQFLNVNINGISNRATFWHFREIMNPLYLIYAQTCLLRNRLCWLASLSFFVSLALSLSASSAAIFMGRKRSKGDNYAQQKA